MPKKSRIAAAGALAAALAFVCCFANCSKQPAAESGPIKIGVIVPLTGDAAQWGIPPRNGAQLAADEINAAGGVNGRKIELLIEDGKCDPQTAVTAFNSLRARYNVEVVLGEVGSSATLAIAPIAEREHVALISPASTNPKITDAGDFIFRVIPSDALRGKVFAEYLHDDLKLNRVAILYINNEGGVGNRDSFKARFTELGGKVIADEAYAQDANDVRSQLTKIKASDAEALMVVSYPRDTVIVMKQAKELNLGKPLYFQTEAVEDSNVLREAGSTAEGVAYILPAPAEGEAADRFAKAYEKRFGKKSEIFAAEAYDIIQLIAAAIGANPKASVTGEMIRDYLYGVKGRASASGTITFDQNGDVVKPMAIKRIKDGTPVVVLTK